MTTVRTVCGCGPIELAPDAITIDLEAAEFSFICPDCGLTVHDHRPPRTMEILRAVGCRVGPCGPITEGEIAAFVERLGL